MTAFALAIFTGAFLLLQVQPLIGKYLLPWFGGGTAVWTTCLLFFQVLLLGGYAYAHGSARWLRPRVQAAVHLALVAGALAMLPLSPGAPWQTGAGGDPTWRILWLLAGSIGLPYFVLSATGPLLQQWWTVVRPEAPPWRLYALSNAGSLLGLVSYPFVFEPVFTRRTQAVLWSWGLVVYAVGCAWCAVRVWKTGARGQKSEVRGQWSVVSGQKSEAPPAPPSAFDRCLWFLLPACGSVLLLAITHKLCQDVAVIPFLWVLPLGLYLLSFVLCFDSPRWYWRKSYGLALIPTLLLLHHQLFEPVGSSLWVGISVFAWALFNCCMVCQGELYRLRPHPRHLTGFYLMIAAGGAAGGVLVAVVAPRIFSDYWELHWGLILFAVLLVAMHRRKRTGFTLGKRRFLVWKPVAAAGLALAWLLTVHFTMATTGYQLAIARNFYGVLRVTLEGMMPEAQGTPNWAPTLARKLICGSTIHGLQPLDPAIKALPTAYYHEQSGIGLVMRHFPRKENRRVGIVGLGIGTLAAYGRAGDLFRFYDINPVVERFAQEYFTYLTNSAARVEIVLGDGRLSLEQEPPQQYDVLVLDAFNSDAIPVHLLTREAFEVYLRHLKPDGVIAVHISTRYLDLAPVLDNVAARFQMHSANLDWDSPSRPWWTLPTQWYLLSRNADLLNLPEIRAAGLGTEAPGKEVRLWTDDYASLYPLLR